MSKGMTKNFSLLELAKWYVVRRLLRTVCLLSTVVRWIVLFFTAKMQNDKRRKLAACNSEKFHYCIVYLFIFGVVRRWRKNERKKNVVEFHLQWKRFHVVDFSHRCFSFVSILVEKWRGHQHKNNQRTTAIDERTFHRKCSRFLFDDTDRRYFFVLVNTTTNSENKKDTFSRLEFRFSVFRHQNKIVPYFSSICWWSFCRQFEMASSWTTLKSRRPNFTIWTDKKTNVYLTLIWHFFAPFVIVDRPQVNGNSKRMNERRKKIVLRSKRSGKKSFLFSQFEEVAFFSSTLSSCVVFMVRRWTRTFFRHTKQIDLNSDLGLSQTALLAHSDNFRLLSFLFWQKKIDERHLVEEKTHQIFNPRRTHKKWDRSV